MPIASSVIGLGSSLLGGIFGSSAANSAAKAQTQALGQAVTSTNDAVKSAQNAITGGVSNANQTLASVLPQQQGVASDVLQQQQGTVGSTLQQQQQQLNPYLQLGTAGVNSLASALSPGGGLTNQFSFDPSGLQNSPDYKFNLDQGLQAVQRAAAANGTLNSGGTLKSAAQYASGLASNELNAAYSRALNTFNTNRQSTLQNLQLPLSIGQQAVSQNQNALQNAGSLGFGALQNFGSTNENALSNYGNLTSSNFLNGGQLFANTAMQGNQTLAQLYAGIGNANASGAIGSQNQWTNALNGAAGVLKSPNVTNFVGGLFNQQAGPTQPQFQSPGGFPYSSIPYGTGVNFGASGPVPGSDSNALSSLLGPNSLAQGLPFSSGIRGGVLPAFGG